MIRIRPIAAVRAARLQREVVEFLDALITDAEQGHLVDVRAAQIARDDAECVRRLLARPAVRAAPVRRENEMALSNTCPGMAR